MIRRIGALLGGLLLAAIANCAVAGTTLTVDVPGVDDALRAKIRNVLLVGKAIDAGAPDPESLIASAQADYSNILSVLYATGRYSPVVSIRLDGREAAEVSPFATPQEISNIRISVTPGPKFTFGQAEIAPLPDGFSPGDAFQPGKQATTTAIREAAQAAVQQWRRLGHAKAEVTSQRIIANHPARRLDVMLRVAPGPELRFGRVGVTGNSAVRAERILEIAGIPKGARFHPEHIDDAQTRLRRTGVFRSVSISEADRPNADDTLDLSVGVIDEKPRRFGFGAEMSSIDGGRLSAFWLHRNLFGGAERLRIGGDVSGITATGDAIDYKLEMRFGRPATFTPDTDFYLTGRLQHQDQPGYLSDSAAVEAGLSHIFSERLTARFGVGYSYSDVEDSFGKRQFSILSAPASATFDTRDNAMDPRSGYYLSGELVPYAGLGGSASGVYAKTDSRGYVGLGRDDAVVLAGRLQLGSVWGPTPKQTVPDFLFYSGGGGTVRGQAFQSLGFDTAGGDIVGGQSFAALSTELRFRGRGKLGVVGFYDAGYITEKSVFSGGTKWHSGAGIGLRYETGIGPIRLDLATPASGTDAGQRLEIYVGIGQAF